jgi:protein gp37
MKIEWVRSIQMQCRKAHVAFFFKQWCGVRKSETGRSLDGRTYDELPERSEVCVPDLEFRRTALQRLEAKGG